MKLSEAEWGEKLRLRLEGFAAVVESNLQSDRVHLAHLNSWME